MSCFDEQVFCHGATRVPIRINLKINGSFLSPRHLVIGHQWICVSPLLIGRNPNAIERLDLCTLDVLNVVCLPHITPFPVSEVSKETCACCCIVNALDCVGADVLLILSKVLLGRTRSFNFTVFDDLIVLIPYFVLWLLGVVGLPIELLFRGDISEQLVVLDLALLHFL